MILRVGLVRRVSQLTCVLVERDRTIGQGTRIGKSVDGAEGRDGVEPALRQHTRVLKRTEKNVFVGKQDDFCG